MSKERILVLGFEKDRLRDLLVKLGYEVIQPDPEKSLPDFVSKIEVDAIVMETSSVPDVPAFCEFARGYEPLKASPIIITGKEKGWSNILREHRITRFEYMIQPVSIGLVAGRLATQLRLRKSDGERESGSSLADRNAFLRDHNERMQKEREQARKIQESLLPKKIPSGDNFEISVAYRPLEEVGGDWYFVTQEKDGKIAFLIADVTGHGISAAFIGAMTKLAINAAATVSPSDLLERINKLMCPVLPEARFVTMAAYLYDPKTGELEFARAGHPPGYFVAPNPTPENANAVVIKELKPPGLGVGFDDDAKFISEKTTLTPGGYVFMCTDGILEAQNRAGKMFAAVRLNDVLEKLSTLSAEANLKALFRELDDFRDGRIINDDVTALVLKRTK